MPRSYPADTLEQGKDVLEAWRNIDPAFKIGDLALPALETELTEAGDLQKQLSSLESQLTDLRNRRDALGASIWDKIKRVRTGVKAAYGDDSSQYEMVGGTRLSERKPIARKKSSS